MWKFIAGMNSDYHDPGFNTAAVAV